MYKICFVRTRNLNEFQGRRLRDVAVRTTIIWYQKDIYQDLFIQTFVFERNEMSLNVITFFSKTYVESVHNFN